MKHLETLRRQRWLVGFLIAGIVVALLAWARSERRGEYVSLTRYDGAQISVKRSQVVMMETTSRSVCVVLSNGQRVAISATSVAKAKEELGL